MFAVSEADLKEISPYNPEEFMAATKRVFSHPAFSLLAQEFFPSVPIEALREKGNQLKSVYEFQSQFIDVVLKTIEKTTSRGVRISGLENKSKDLCYLYISNHRDIILDSALFTDMLFRKGFSTPQICLGDNLLRDPLAIDLSKMNKGITVKRDLPPRELLRWSYTLSQCIRQTITSGTDSVWIAQQEGRAKDGCDTTHPGVVKMLALTGEGDFVARLKSLRIVPVSVSYEYDPNDVEKSLELYLTEKDGNYKKKPGEDLRSVNRGLKDYKGGIAVHVGEELGPLLERMPVLQTKPEQVTYVTETLNRRIKEGYYNWPTNYIAHDLLNKTNRFQCHYTEDLRNAFTDRLEKRLSTLSLLENEKASVRERTLKMYATSISPPSLNKQPFSDKIPSRQL